jgi:hypothetical protein
VSGPVLADIIDHGSIKEVAPGHWTESTHAAWMAKDCPHCQRITKLLRAFREFGYSDLTVREQREAYHVAMLRKPTATDGIIAMMTRSQLVEAGLVKEDEA